MLIWKMHFFKIKFMSEIKLGHPDKTIDISMSLIVNFTRNNQVEISVSVESAFRFVFDNNETVQAY